MEEEDLNIEMEKSIKENLKKERELVEELFYLTLIMDRICTPVAGKTD